MDPLLFKGATGNKTVTGTSATQPSPEQPAATSSGEGAVVPSTGKKGWVLWAAALGLAGFAWISVKDHENKGTWWFSRAWGSLSEMGQWNPKTLSDAEKKAAASLLINEDK
jgi:hypothetical protein